ncbi:MAG: excinuclease ABC subunit C [Bacteroidetes bacterium HGW-Bacteroidetes-4]|jgi:excinuclease ABC subunit C|nr:MAG: excinuclease ABC subunit C [Bacteroidetes bacterium HGW-Bacteroidetes-4]
MKTDEKHIEKLKELVATLPDNPGVYQYFDTEGTIIYVGKAKNLKKRVSSYFTKYHDSAKTRILVRKISDIKHIVVDSEQDALLLENNLIKKYQPRYNALLKDDKTYPWICIKSEAFPRVLATRNYVRDGSTYFGPYTSGRTLRVMLDFIRQLYPIRTCSLNLSPVQIAKGKYKVCLEYHIGNCLGPCVGEQSEADYLQNIQDVKDILRGNIGQVIKLLKDRMSLLSKEYRFEEAQKLKEKLNHLENYQAKSTIVSQSIHNVDVFSYVEHENSAFVNFLKVVNGAVIQVHTVELKKRTDEDKEMLLLTAIVEIRQRLNSTSREIIVPFELDFEFKAASFLVPQRGDKKKLLDLSMRNAFYFKQEKIKQEVNRSPQKAADRVMETMKRDLRLKEAPIHIEGFDNSNIQGTNPVASCVVFKNGKPSKRDYRHFNVKTVEGPDDFASMEEIIYRRYHRQLNEGQAIPQLIVIDGGKGQLGAAVKSLTQLKLIGRIAVIGIAKKLEEIYFPGDSVPLYLDKNSETLKIIQHIRNESHRFGINFHRQKRSQNFITSELDAVEGIGPKTVEQLLTHFKSVENIKQASPDELSQVIGKAKAQKLMQFFKKNN